MTTGAILKKDVPPKNKIDIGIDPNQVLNKDRLNVLDSIEKINVERDKNDFLDFDGENYLERSEEDESQEDKSQSEEDTLAEEEPGDKADLPDSEDAGEQDNEGEPQENEGATGDADDDAEYETLIVNGEETRVAKDKILDHGRRSMQKELSADKKLQEASELLKNLQREQQIIADMRYQESRRGSDGKADEPDPIKLQLDVAKGRMTSAQQRYVETTVSGSTEDQTRALNDLNRAMMDVFKLENTQQGSSKEELEQYFQEQMGIRDQQSEEARHASILKSLERPPEDGGYQDLLADRMKYVLFNEEVNKRLAGDEPDVLETYVAAGDAVREFLGIKPAKDAESGAVPSKPKGNNIANKRDMKLKTEDQIRASSSVAQSDRKEQKPFSEAEAIQIGLKQLQEQRGQLFR